MKHNKLFVLAFVAGALLSGPAFAQNEAVVVTGTSIRGSDDSSIPGVTLRRRAEHLVTRVRVLCDTRDADKRKAEIRDTLRNMIRTAGQSQTLSLSVGDEVLNDLTEGMIDKIIVPDSRPDTSRAVVVIKTKILPTDTINDATVRVTDFVGKTQKIGRVEILGMDTWDLTLIGPQQYRTELIARIGEDAKQIMNAFGPGYNISAEGLQQPVAWYRSGPLELALFIPYRLSVSPPK
jgi:hypothetical protein